MKQLTATDSIFVFNDSASAPLHISPLLIYEQRSEEEAAVRFKEILQRFEERLHKSPVFRRKLVRVPLDLDRPYWVDEADFDLEFHLRHIALPKPGDWRQLCILLARLHSRPIDLTRPPWEAYVIEGLDNINGLPSGCFALYMKIHHAAIDGATGNMMIEALHDIAPDASVESGRDDWAPEDEPGTLKLLSKAYFNFVFGMPGQAIKLVKHAAKSRQEAVRKIVDSVTESHDIKGRIRFNEDVTAHRVYGGLRMTLEEVKLIKNSAEGCTINDTLLSIVSGTLRHYLSEKGEQPDFPLLAGVPISMRSAANTNAEGGNEVSGMRLHLRADIEDPLERLQAINNDAITSKAYADAIGAERLTTIVNSIPSGIASLGMRAVTATGLAARTPVAHTIVTNVPGPQFPLYFCGAKALLWAGIGVLTNGTGLFHTVNSYNGFVFLSFLSCREMMPDPDVYHSCLTRSFNEHLESASAAAPNGLSSVETG